EIGSPDQRITIRPRTGLKAFLVQRFLDEGVYGIRLPPRISYVWNRAPLRFPERPPTPILRRDRLFLVILRRRPGRECGLWLSDHALPHGRATDTVNPGFQSRDLLLCQRRQRRHWHPGFIQTGHAAVEQARLGVPRNDGRPFFSALQRGLERAQVETSHLNRFAVALDTFLVQDGEGFFVRRLSFQSVRARRVNKAEAEWRGQQYA